MDGDEAVDVGHSPRDSGSKPRRDRAATCGRAARRAAISSSVGASVGAQKASAPALCALGFSYTWTGMRMVLFVVDEAPNLLTNPPVAYRSRT